MNVNLKDGLDDEIKEVEKKYRKHHTVALFALIFILIAILYFTDPDHGASTLMIVLGIASGMLAVGVTHLIWKSMFDFPEMNLQRMFKKSQESPEGSGLALIAIAIVMASLLLMFGSKAHAAGARVDVQTYIPENANVYAPTLVQQQKLYWADHPTPYVLGGLVEQESCISLTYKSCWNPRSQLKTSREEGAGLGQITRAYDAIGNTRMDALKAMTSKYPVQLSGLTWDTVYTRPDLQLRAMVLQEHDSYVSVQRVVPDALDLDRLSFTDASYNGGYGGLSQDRRKCQLIKGCNPKVWFGNVEKSCSKSTQPIYGNRSACDINREHVYSVMNLRSAKYKKFFG